MSNFSASDFTFMAQALRLAEQGLHSTSPNPRVGCVIVKDGKVIGEGAHLKAGEAHAEVFALRQAGAESQGATAYVTLEPCSHTGRTPPCADALIQADITRVVIAMQDPNPLVAGTGIQKLTAHGIDVSCGLLEAQAHDLNAGFVLRMTQQRPFVRSKVAASLDGRTALSNGESQWITSEASRLDVQQWRARSCAIVTGIGTVLADNPQLNVRAFETPRQPLRVVVDSQLKTPIDANIVNGGNTLIVYGDDANHRAPALINAGAELLQLPSASGQVDLTAMLTALAQRGMNEVLCEAGATLNGALLAQGLVDELLMYFAPSLMGDASRGMFALPILTQMQQRIQLHMIDVRQVGSDIRLRAKPIAG